jgi:hypothetical protein
MRTFLLFITFIFTVSISNARICNSTGNGNWGNAASWSCPGGPGPGDTVNILAGHIIVMAANAHYNSGDTPMHINIAGTLHFNNGRKMTLPCGSSLSTSGNGQVTADGYNGNSENIVICNVTVWSADQGPVTEPITFTDIPLPVQLLSFTANVKANSIHVFWTTASEKNNDFYTIERSLNGYDYTVIANIKGAGTSNNIINYQYIDAFPENGINYYRLKQTDFDGTYTYSEIIAVKYSFEDNQIKAFPNPVNSNNFTITGLNNNENYVISIYDIAGKKMLEKKVQNKREEILSTTLKFPEGVYFIHVLSETSVHKTLKISVQ